MTIFDDNSCDLTLDTWDTDYIADNWEQQYKQLLCDLWIKCNGDSIHNSCDVLLRSGSDLTQTNAIWLRLYSDIWPKNGEWSLWAPTIPYLSKRKRIHKFSNIFIKGFESISHSCFHVSWIKTTEISKPKKSQTNSNSIHSILSEDNYRQTDM